MKKKLVSTFRENKKLFWEEVNKVGKSKDSASQFVKDVNGIMLENEQ